MTRLPTLLLALATLSCRALCWLGFHRVTRASVWWPHEAKCDRCGRTLLMDTSGQWFDPADHRCG